MRELGVRLPPSPPPKRGRPWRDAFFFLVSFLAVFIAALIVLDLLAPS